MKWISLILFLFEPFFLPAQFQYPETKKIDTIDDYHGTKISDPYRWLEDDNSEETKAWVQAQNKITNDYLETIPYRENVSCTAK